MIDIITVFSRDNGSIAVNVWWSNGSSGWYTATGRQILFLAKRMNNLQLSRQFQIRPFIETTPGWVATRVR